MGASDDEDDYVFYGTPIDDDEETRAGQRRKEIKDPALTRQLPLHKQVSGVANTSAPGAVACMHLMTGAGLPLKTRSLRAMRLLAQEVTDAEGRRRFHGAFTGGYSAGYYNTVGSLEGWAPSTFKSSRDTRTETRFVCHEGDVRFGGPRASWHPQGRVLPVRGLITAILS